MVALAEAAVDDGERNGVAVFQQQQGWHGQRLGHTTAYAYDTAGRLASIASPGGSKVLASVRDAAGLPTTIFQTFLSNNEVAQFSLTNVFDPLGRWGSSTDNVGNTSSCAYDSLGRVVHATDPNSNDSTYAYDLLGNCLTSTDYAGSSSVQPTTVIRSSHASFDLNSRCLTSTDGNGNTTGYAYDSRDRLVAITHADGTHSSLVWSPRGNLLGETDANGTVSTNTYDLCDRLLRRDVDVQGAAVATTTFETFAYDGCSRLVLANNDASSLAFAYDSLGNAVSASQDGLTTTRTFDATGNCRSLTYPSGRVVTYVYNALDCVTNVATTKDGISFPSLTNIGYAGDRVVSLTRANGINTRIDWDGQLSPTNPVGDFGWQQIGRVRHGTAQTPSLLADLAGSYSRTQSKTTQADAVSGRGTSLTYDALDRLVGSTVHLPGTPALDTAYTLDADGNRLLVTGSGGTVQNYTMSSAVPPGDAQMNRYFDPKTGRRITRGGMITHGDDVGRGFADNNPWSGGGGSCQMKNGTVKFFSVAKGFGRVVGGGSGPRPAFNTLTNVQKARHDAAMAAIQNTR
ncbi:MAG: hypothetical protein NTW21_29770 [Verrucomicrobia bacterium]|nr:hypothetical protein [Verrucomicrobiota bacterium]